MILPTKKMFSWGFPMFDDTGSSPCSVVVVSPHQRRSRHHDCKWRQKGTKFRSSLMALAQNFASTQWRLTGYHRWWRSQPATFSRQPASQPATVGWWFEVDFLLANVAIGCINPPDPARKKRPPFLQRAQTAVTDRPSLLIAAKWEGSTKKTEIKIQWQSWVLSMSCICHLFVSFDKSSNYLVRFKRSTCRTQSCDVTWLWATFFWVAKKRWAKCFKQISAPGR